MEEPKPKHIPRRYVRDLPEDSPLVQIYEEETAWPRPLKEHVPDWIKEEQARIQEELKTREAETEEVDGKDI